MPSRQGKAPKDQIHLQATNIASATGVVLTSVPLLARIRSVLLASASRVGKPSQVNPVPVKQGIQEKMPERVLTLKMYVLCGKLSVPVEIKVVTNNPAKARTKAVEIMEKAKVKAAASVVLITASARNVERTFATDRLRTQSATNVTKKAISRKGISGKVE